MVSFPEDITDHGGRPKQGGGRDFSPGVAYLASIGIVIILEDLVAVIVGPPAPKASAVVANFAKKDVVITEEQSQALLETLSLP